MKQFIFILMIMVWGLQTQINAGPPSGYRDFVITVKTNNSGTSSNTQFTIPTFGKGYNYNVDCNNDGTNDKVAQIGDVTCNYAIAGTYTIRIKDNRGDKTGFPRIYFNFNGDRKKLLAINQWGNLKWTSMHRAFMGCENLDVQTTDTPDLSRVSDSRSMFEGCYKLVGATSNWEWDTSFITDMYRMFRNNRKFNQDIGTWDTSHVTNMHGMFNYASVFNQDIGNWDTSLVNDMAYMFSNAYKFNQNLASWNIENVITMDRMFAFDTLSTYNWDAILINWDKQNVKSDVKLHGGNSHYCHSASARANLILSDTWDITDAGLDCVGTEDFIITVKTDNDGTSSDTQFTIPTRSAIFNYNYNVDCDNDGTDDKIAQTGDVTCSYTNEGIYTIRIKDNVGDGTGFPKIYFNNSEDKQKLLDINQWGTSKWRTMGSAFYGCSNLRISAIDNPDLENVTSFYKMFQDATLFNQNINDWNTSNITDMGYMFDGAIAFNQELGAWNTSKVLYMDYMFNGATTFNQDIGEWNTSKVIWMTRMFEDATTFNQNLSKWNVENVTTMNDMFKEVTLDTYNWDNILISWDTQVVKNGVTLNGGNSHYCRGENARAHLIASDDWNITDAGKECINPDYRTILTVYGGIVNGVGTHPFSFDTLVRNIQSDSNYNASSPLKIIIPKNEALTLTFHPETTMFKGQNVDNSLWNFDDSDMFDYIMTYTGDDISTGRTRFSVEGMLRVEEGEVGKFFLETTIQSSTGGDNNSDNNSDRETLQKRL